MIWGENKTAIIPEDEKHHVAWVCTHDENHTHKIEKKSISDDFGLPFCSENKIAKKRYTSELS